MRAILIFGVAAATMVTAQAQSISERGCIIAGAATLPKVAGLEILQTLTKPIRRPGKPEPDLQEGPAEIAVVIRIKAATIEGTYAGICRYDVPEPKFNQGKMLGPMTVHGKSDSPQDVMNLLMETALKN